MSMRILVCLLSIGVLAGCIHEDSPTVVRVSDEVSLSTEFSTDALLESTNLDGYISAEGVELVYGSGILATRADGGDWSIENADDFYVYGAEIIGPEHWIVGTVRLDQDDEWPHTYSIEETIDAGVTWTSTELTSNSENALYLSEFEYDYANDRLFTAIDLGLGVSDLPVEEFNILEEGNEVAGTARKLLMNPNRDEIWLFGNLELASTGAVDTTFLKRFDLSGDTVSTMDLTDEISFSNVNGGMIHTNDPNTVFVAGSGGIFRTEDNGANWSQVLSNGNVANVVQSQSAERTYAVRETQDGVELLCSQNSGNTWVGSFANLEGGLSVTAMESDGDELVLILNRSELLSVPMSEVPCEL